MTSVGDLPAAVAEARAFAMAAHGDQRYGDQPYVVHLDEVHRIVHEHAARDDGPPSIQAVLAYLHDVVEDTEVTLEQIEQRFGAEVSRCVDLLTDSPGRNRKERKARTYARLEEVDETGPLRHALVVKAADRLANARRCVAQNNERLLAMYRAEHPTFRRSAVRPGLATSMWEQLDRILG